MDERGRSGSTEDETAVGTDRASRERVLRWSRVSPVSGVLRRETTLDVFIGSLITRHEISVESSQTKDRPDTEEADDDLDQRSR